MNIGINLGNWNSVFAFPSSIVDNHIKLAGAAQLKVLLYILRHAGETFTIDDVASFLSMNPADVKDSLLYWKETNVISLNEGQIEPGKNSTPSQSQNIEPTKTEEHNKPNLSPRPISKPRKPDRKFVSQRIAESEQISFLMQEAQVILGRLISDDDAATLLMLHDNDGLPIDVIIMLLQYSVSNGKKNMKYIEKVGIEWGQDEIDSIQKAEAKIKKLEQSKEAWSKICNIFGLEKRSPTTKENEAANRWVNEWKMPDELIYEAYNRCIDSIGKYRTAYVDKVITKFYKSGIKTIEQANEEQAAKKAKHGKGHTSSPSYNINEYEKWDMFA